MLDERKAAILRAVVQEYIETAQPVGSGHVARPPASRSSAPRCATRWPCSSRRATSPSPTPPPAASRPTRATASSSTTSAVPGGSSRARPARSATFFAHAHGALEQMLQDTSRLLSNLTDYAAVVVGPRPRGGRRCRSVQLVGLAPAGGAGGRRPVQRRRREAPSSCRRRHRRARLARRLARTSRPTWGVGRRCPTARAALPGTTGGRPAVRRRAIDRAPPAPSATTTATTCSSAGRPRMARAFDAVDIVRRVSVDPRAAVRRGARAPRRARPRPPVAIGAEHGVELLARRARSSWRPITSTASRSAPSACSAHPHELPAGPRRGRVVSERLGDRLGEG